MINPYASPASSPNISDEDPAPGPIGQKPTGVRHAVVAAATLMAVLLYLDRFCISFAGTFIQKDLGLSDDQMGAILSAFFWTYALAQVPSGWLTDHLGARLMLSLYILLWSLLTGMTALAGGFLLLYLFRMGFGVAQAGAFPSCAVLLRNWVPLVKRGKASSIVALGGRIGGFLAPILTAQLIFLGWQSVMWLFAAAGLLVAGVFLFLFRDTPRKHPRCNAAEIQLIEGDAVGASQAASQHGFPWGPLLTSPSMWLCSLSQIGTNIGWVFLVTWLPFYLEEVHQVPVKMRGLMTAAPLFVGMLGMYCGGLLTDRLIKRIGLRWGRALPMGLSRFLAMLAYLLCLLPWSSWLGSQFAPWLLTCLLCVVAFATDLGVPAVWAFNQDVGGKYAGSILGWGNMWGNFGAAIAPWLLPMVLGPKQDDLPRNWEPAFMICAAGFLVAGVAALGVNAARPITKLTADNA